MLGLELVVVLGISILVCQVAGRRLHVAPTILLVAAGVLLWFVPALRAVHLPPEAMLLLFLPALLYWEAISTSLRQLRTDFRGVMLMATVLVVATAAAVAAVAHTAGMPWGPAWVLGAALAPTDATAVGVISRLLPSRQMSLLRAESLINDGTALVIYGVAVAIAVGEQEFSWPRIGEMFAVSYIGGVVVGVVIAWLGLRVRRHLDDPLLINLVIVLTPFTAYLLAELIHASGVLAVVVAGLVVARVAPRIGSARARRMTEDTWSLITFLLNASLFVLIGLEAQSAVRDLESMSIAGAVGLVVIVAVVLLMVRLVFQFGAIYLIRALDRRPSQRERRVSHRSRIVTSMAGLRGAVSVAVALSVPQTLDSGESFPDRDLIIFVTIGVIVIQLLLQVPVLPAVVRWARLPADRSSEQEYLLAGSAAVQSALEALDDTAAALHTDPAITEQVRRGYEDHLQALRAARRHETGETPLRKQQYVTLRRALLDHKRNTVIRLRDQQRIDDTILLRVQTELDTEETQLSPPEFE
ncbi:Na+/H+ antiporter [Nocardia sp. NPDC059180]|uniref:Na+/H+ antiporter n=1 Tax=Nocardia sp. NPDC059180 TaxID=3346761 RepID=UPI0036B77F48